MLDCEIYLIYANNSVRRCEMAGLQLIVLITTLFTRDIWHLDKETNKLQ